MNVVYNEVVQKQISHENEMSEEEVEEYNREFLRKEAEVEKIASVRRKEAREKIEEKGEIWIEEHKKVKEMNKWENQRKEEALISEELEILYVQSMGTEDLQLVEYNYRHLVKTKDYKGSFSINKYKRTLKIVREELIQRGAEYLE